MLWTHKCLVFFPFNFYIRLFFISKYSFKLGKYSMPFIIVIQTNMIGRLTLVTSLFSFFPLFCFSVWFYSFSSNLQKSSFCLSFRGKTFDAELESHLEQTRPIFAAPKNINNDSRLRNSVGPRRCASTSNPTLNVKRGDEIKGKILQLTPKFP